MSNTFTNSVRCILNPAGCNLVCIAGISWRTTASRNFAFLDKFSDRRLTRVDRPLD